jgi:3-hydroxyisobutyrate dehydrogenase-like beta-hydroxyacid dehydrogenase
VIGIDVQQARRDAWAASGGAAVASSIDAAEHAEAVFIVVTDGHDAVRLGRELTAGQAGPTVYILSTISPQAASEIGVGASEQRCWPIPVTGGELRALRGDLLAIVPATLPIENEQFLYRTIASRVVRAADARSAALAKLLSNALIAYEFAGLAALLDVASGLGLDPRLLLSMAQGGSSGSDALRALFEYSPAGLRKDLDLLSGVSLPAVGPFSAPHGIERARSILRAAEG